MRNFFLFLLLIAFVSCSNSIEVEEKPAIDNATMEKILKDMALADCMVEMEMLPNNTKIYQKKFSYYDDILKKYDVSEVDFVSSYKIYAKNYDELIATYDSISLSFNSLQIKTETNE